MVYCVAQNFGKVKLWQIDHFKVSVRENVGEFTIANISYFSESGIWLGKTMANAVRLAKFAKVFPYQNCLLYSTTLCYVSNNLYRFNTCVKAGTAYAPNSCYGISWI